MRNRVVFSIHDAKGEYWKYTAAALTSVARYSSIHLQFSILHDETLSGIAKQNLSRIAKLFNMEINFVKINLDETDLEKSYGKFSVASLFRLLIPSIFKNDELVLYLDSDLIFNNVDVKLLFDIQLNKKSIAAVIDPYILNHEEHGLELKKLNINSNNYFNSGVLLINILEQKGDLLQEYLKFYKIFGETIHPDQNFLNFKFHDQFYELSDKFNFHVGNYNNTLFKPLEYYNNKVIHYSGPIKPLDGALSPGMIPFWRSTLFIDAVFTEKTGAVEIDYLYPVVNSNTKLIRRTIPALHLSK